MTNRKDLLKVLCRICAKEDCNSISVFSDSGRKQNIAGKIQVCLPLTVSENDGMPTRICITCLTRLEESWNFVSLCKEAQPEIEDKLRSANLDQRGCNVPNHLSMPIEEKIQYLSESKPVSFGESAVICLAPASPPPPPAPVVPRETVTLPQTVASGSADTVLGTQSVMTPVTYLTSATASSIASTTTSSVPEDVYPQTLIQVPTNPASEPVVYQSRQAPSVPMPRRITVVPKPMATTSMPQTLQAPQRPTPIPVRRQNTEATNGPPTKKAPQMCTYCKKTFPDDIIDHHVSLHLRQSFMTCIECNKNFRSQVAMDKHRCGASDTINLDNEDESIL